MAVTVPVPLPFLTSAGIAMFSIASADASVMGVSAFLSQAARTIGKAAAATTKTSFFISRLLDVDLGVLNLSAPPHQQIGGRNDEHREQRCGEHPANHGRGDAAHHFGAGAGANEDRE